MIIFAIRSLSLLLFVNVLNFLIEVKSVLPILDNPLDFKLNETETFVCNRDQCRIYIVKFYMRAPPPGPICFIFMQFSGENWPNNRLASPLDPRLPLLPGKHTFTIYCTNSYYDCFGKL